LLGKLVATLEAQPEWQHTTFVIVSDHGFAPIAHEIRLNALFARHHLIELDADGKTKSARVAVIASGGTAFVYVLDPKARGEIEAALNEVTVGVAKTYTPDEVAAAGGDRTAAWVLAAAPGYWFGDARTGELVVETPGKGTHGYPPTDPARPASFIAGARRPARLGASMVDIAPTMAHGSASLPNAPAASLAPASNRALAERRARRRDVHHADVADSPSAQCHRKRRRPPLDAGARAPLDACASPRSRGLAAQPSTAWRPRRSRVPACRGARAPRARLVRAAPAVGRTSGAARIASSGLGNLGDQRVIGPASNVAPTIASGAERSPAITGDG
jgi:hypothetical protein